jgi:hypothetical protein
LYDNPYGDVYTNNIGVLTHDCFHQPCLKVNLTLLHIWHKKGICGINRAPEKRELKIILQPAR